MSTLDFNAARHQPTLELSVLPTLMEAVAHRLLGRPNQALSKHRKLRFGRQGSLSVNLDQGTFHDFEVGAGGGVLDLIVRERGGTKGEAVAWLQSEGLLGKSDDQLGSRPQQNRGRGPELRHRQFAGQTDPGPGVRPPQPSNPWLFWNACPLIKPGTPAFTYLVEARGCAEPHSEGDLRWHSAHKHPSGYYGPVLVARVTDAVTGEPMTLHRTWLARDGLGKAAIPDPRRLWPGAPKAGGVIRLWPDEEVTGGLAIAEGIETALVAARGFTPIWACIDAGNLAAFPALDGIQSLTIIADHDYPSPKTGRRAGQEAAERCAQRWHEAGREVRIWLAPTEGDDFADHAARSA
jgi:hypothetical protein